MANARMVRVGAKRRKGAATTVARHAKAENAQSAGECRDEQWPMQRFAFGLGRAGEARARRRSGARRWQGGAGGGWVRRPRRSRGSRGQRSPDRGRLRLTLLPRLHQGLGFVGCRGDGCSLRRHGLEGFGVRCDSVDKHGQRDIAQAEDVPRCDAPAVQPLSVDADAVRAPCIADDEALGSDLHDRVATGALRVVENDVTGRIPTENRKGRRNVDLVRNPAGVPDLEAHGGDL